MKGVTHRVKVEPVEYWQLDLETKVNLADGFISELAVKYCEQQMKLNNPLKAVAFSKEIYQIQQLFTELRSAFRRVEFDHFELSKEVRNLKAKLFEYERTDKELNEIVNPVKNDEIEAKHKAEILEIKDKYQIRIQELEVENEELTKALAKKLNS